MAHFKNRRDPVRFRSNPSMGLCRLRGLFAVACVLCLDLCLGHEGSCPHSGFSSPEPQVHGCGDHDHDHDEGHHHHHDHGHHHEEKGGNLKLPEELAEEEDLKLYGFGTQYGHDHHHHHHHHHHVDGQSGESDLSGLGLWVHALGCSLLVSMASLICLIILPVMFVQGKPSKAIVDSLALFGAGAMLGDAFLHQLPHAFGGGHSHSDDHSVDHSHLPQSGHEHHHSLKDLSVGMSILGGIVLFLLVEKLVRYVEEKSRGTNVFNHGHHHHHKSSKKLNDEKDSDDKLHSQLSDGKNEGKKVEKVSDDSLDGDNMGQRESLRKRKASVADGKPEENMVDDSSNAQLSLKERDSAQSPSNLVFGYLNLFSDGVHNFTDGMALGSAFLLYGSVGGWSRTLFLLAHELPQEVGDFGILVRSGFSVTKALFFNFLSALVALGGTTLALLLGQEPGQSSLIEGFTAGGFIYIAVAGVLAEMNNGGHVTLKSTLVQLTSLVMGMGVALFISIVE